MRHFVVMHEIYNQQQVLLRCNAVAVCNKRADAQAYLDKTENTLAERMRRAEIERINPDVLKVKDKEGLKRFSYFFIESVVTEEAAA